MNFKELENQFWQLKGKQSAGVLSDEEFRAEVAKLRLQDAGKLWWTINPKDGTWLVYQDQQWVPGTPPEEKPPEEIPPPPPSPAAKPATPAPAKSPAKEEKTVVLKPQSGDARPRPKRKPRPRVAPSGKAEEVSRPVSPDPVPPPTLAPPKPKPRPPKKAACPKCGSPYLPADKFCGDCGFSFVSTQKPKAKPKPHPAAEVKTEPAVTEVRKVMISRKGIVLTWMIGALLYTALLFVLLTYVAPISDFMSQYTLAFPDALAGILIFTFLLNKNGIKIKIKPIAIPGRDMLFIVGFGLAFVFVTQVVGAWLISFLAAFITEIFNIPLDGIGILAILIALTYLVYVLAGILVSIIGLNLAPRILKK